MKKKPRNAEDISACATLAADSLAEANTRRGRIGLLPRAWRTTNAASSRIENAPKPSVRREVSP